MFVKKLLLIEKTKWTLDYVNSLNDTELYAITEVYDAIDSARNHQKWRASQHGKQYDSGPDWEM